MKTSTLTIRHGVLAALLSLFVALLCVPTHGAEPADTNNKTEQTVHFRAEETHVLPTRYESSIHHDEDGIPLAREDVIPVRTAVTGGSTTPANDSQLKVSSRAADPKMKGFLARTNMQQLASVYLEMSQMVDARHENPPSYEVRTRTAMQNLISALQNETFLRANNVNPQTQAISNVQNQLWQLAQTQPARNANEAVGLMQTSSEIVSRGLGMRREAVALEFLNSSLDALDKYSAFMPEAGTYAPGAEADLVRTANLSENIVGIGVELKGHAQGVEIVDVIDNGPAQQLGLRPGDIVFAIDMQQMAGKSLNEVADRIAGRAGTTVTLDILRGNQKFRGTLARRQVYVGSVSGTKMIDSQSGTGYIRLKQFSQSSKEDLEKAMWTLHQQGMKGLILDLRGNPGGLLDVSIEVVDMFLTSGTIVSTRGRNASDNTTEKAVFAKTWSVPLTVLVDENSASASEIFAAAIQDNGRGVILGRNSYGKGTVQTHFPMRTVSATLKLTTAKFYSPSGREMSGQGVSPDVPVVASDISVRGTTNDADMQAALQMLRQGVPAQMAARSASGHVPGSNPLPMNWNLNQQPAGQTPAYNPNFNRPSMNLTLH